MNDELASNDLPLTATDVGQLADADQVAGFLGRLHYRVDRFRPLDHAALGLDTEDLRVQVRRLWRAAEDPDGGELVVYLIESHSMAVALTQAIARRFRERTENAVLILTKDYETIDFVLVDREVVSGRGAGLSAAARVAMRPRILTVLRRNPTGVDVRVLRRFTYTEKDADYQWEKLRSAFTLAEWAEEYFNNRALFSDYYLRERLTDTKLTPQWAEDARPIGRAALRHLAGARADFTGRPEQAIRQGLFEPLFQELGFRFEVNKPGHSDLDEPDYRLYDPVDPSKPIALAMTYVWNRNLDDTDEGRDKDTPTEIPGALVVNLLAKAEAPWVVMTNGKLWRVYSAAADNKATNYYEVDLEEAVAAVDQITALKYWWLFFRRAAFTGFLGDVAKQSADYARALGDRLKDRTFTTIFPHFADGIIHYQRARGETEPDLDMVFASTMTFLYRLMFVLYAESLGLLPVFEEHGYGELSLDRLKKEIAGAAGKVEDEAPKHIVARYAVDGGDLYARLGRLFQAVDAGDSKLNMPMYNGGLFSDATPEGRFLAENVIPDRFLALGLDRLCRDVDDKTHALAFIDYKSLGVRQLGAIYEGLLEFTVRIAPEKLVVVKEMGKEVYLPARKAGAKRPIATLRKGEVYLENDKRERKATGSYYTPDYIVKYIVQHTVGPVLDTKLADLEPRLREAQKQYRQHERSARAKGDDPAKFWNGPAMQQLADDCLDVKVLDPAMGSGHFLVEAVDFISDRLIGFLNAWSENPVWALLEWTRADILADMDRQGVSIDAERLTRVALLKRAVLKRCIYGVDLNLMAVELAKVSLWLDAFTLGAPLSFLDHHLKHGNSLIGARIAEVREALEAKHLQQLSLLSQSKFTGVMMATDLMRQVSNMSDNTADQLTASRAAFHSASDHLAPYRRVLDVYTSRWFGNQAKSKKAGAVEPALEFLQREYADAWLKDPASVTLPPKDDIGSRAIAETALRVAEEKRFFHWELEFPEVFFAPRTPGGRDVDLREDGGFDAVVGNPPWISAWGMTDSDPNLRSTLAALCDPNELILHAHWDLYMAFLSRAELLTMPEGQFGYVVPNPLCREQYASRAREHLLAEATLQRILSLGHRNVFEDVSRQAVVIVVRDRLPPPDNEITVDESTVGSEIRFSHRVQQLRFSGVPGKQLRYELTHKELDLLDKIDSQSMRHGDICYVNYGAQISSAEKGGFGKQRMLDSRPHGNAQRFFEGKNTDRYEIMWPGLYLDYRPAVMYGPRVPELFESDKLVFRHVSGNNDTLIVALDRDQLYCDHGLVLSTHYSNLASTSAKSEFRGYEALGDGPGSGVDLRFLLALFASRLLSRYYADRYATGSLQGTYSHVYPQAVRALPVFSVNLATTSEAREQLAHTARDLYHRPISDSLVHLLDFVAEQLAADRTDVIHDLLAFLAEQMIDLHKRKRAEITRFLAWIESRLGVPSGAIDTLTGKSILRNYLGDYQKGEPELPWDDFYYRLHQNRRRFGVPLAEVAGEIQAEYEKSLAALVPIKRQLAQTDALIDQIVYKLYGLTDEEIEIIERPAYEQALTEAKAKVIADEKLQTDPEAAAEAVAEAMLPAARRLREQVALATEREHLGRDLPGWHLFPDEVATFLLTGEYNIRTQPDFLDFSTSVISYAKAVETMLGERIFARFRAESGATEADCANSFLQAFMRGEKRLTLGSMGIILRSSKETALRAFIAQVYARAATTFFGPGGIAERLDDPTNVDLRNRAAHDTHLGRDDARAARAWAVGILGQL